MARFYTLAIGKEKDSSGYSRPVFVDICFEQTNKQISLSKGDSAKDSVGCVISASAALDLKWKEHFEESGGIWLIPYIEEMASKGGVSKTVVLEHFQRLNGHAASYIDIEV